ncbi:MAG: GRP family sugar transporter [Bacteroidaceae bacterium]|nr:GRP family sugar transporter [Bacteroidaceae bacterium]
MSITGIIFLIIATVLTAMFSIVFKIFHRKDIDANQAIFFNYLTAFILGVLFSLNGEAVVNPLKADWLVDVIILGFIFMAGMVMLSASTRRVGVAISTVCSRASMVIPIIVSYLLIEGSAKPKWLLICLVLVAMTLTIWTDKPEGGHKYTLLDILAPVTVFLTFGASNSYLKVLQHRVTVNDTAAGLSEQVINSEISLVTASVFFVAMIMCIYSFFKKGPDGKRSPLLLKNVTGGVVLGFVNYFCTYTLMLSMKTIDSSFLFPVHNIGIVAIGAIVGWLAFNEKLRPHQVVGIVLAAVSIALLCI